MSSKEVLSDVCIDFLRQVKRGWLVHKDELACYYLEKNDYIVKDPARLHLAIQFSLTKRGRKYIRRMKRQARVERQKHLDKMNRK